jgi:hypothetical protein
MTIQSFGDLISEAFDVLAGTLHMEIDPTVGEILHEARHLESTS